MKLDPIPPIGAKNREQLITKVFNQWRDFIEKLTGYPLSEWMGNWAPYTEYLTSNVVVSPNGDWYSAKINHTSSNSFDSDLANGKWELLLEVSVIEQYKLDAEAARDAAQTSETNAATSESKAADSEANAKTSENNAAASATLSTNYAVESKNWATYPEDYPVPEGNGSEFSSYHWAQKALAYNTLPGGGLTGQALVKASDNDRETEWKHLVTSIQAGDGAAVDLSDPQQPVIVVPYAQAENDIINGYFDHWSQNGTQIVAGYQSVDRWYLGLGGSVAGSITREVLSLSQTELPKNARYALQLLANNSLNVDDYVFVRQRVKDWLKWAGKRVCLQFWAKSSNNATGLKLAIEGTQGTYADGELATGIGVQHITLVPEWRKYVVFLDFPAVDDLTYTNGTITWSGIQFWISAGSDYDARTGTLGLQDGAAYIANVEACVGDFEVPVRRRTPEEELLLCQHYLWVGEPAFGDDAALYAGGAGTYQGPGGSFPVHMIRTPSITAKVEPTYTNCSLNYYWSSPNRFALVLSVSGAGEYSATNGLYIANAEI